MFSHENSYIFPRRREGHSFGRPVGVCGPGSRTLNLSFHFHGRQTIGKTYLLQDMLTFFRNKGGCKYSVDFGTPNMMSGTCSTEPDISLGWSDTHAPCQRLSSDVADQSQQKPNKDQEDSKVPVRRRPIRRTVYPVLVVEVS